MSRPHHEPQQSFFRMIHHPPQTFGAPPPQTQHVPWPCDHEVGWGGVSFVSIVQYLSLYCLYQLPLDATGVFEMLYYGVNKVHEECMVLALRRTSPLAAVLPAVSRYFPSPRFIESFRIKVYYELHPKNRATCKFLEVSSVEMP